MRIDTNTDHKARAWEWQSQYVGLGDRIQLESVFGGKGVYASAVYVIMSYECDEHDALMTLRTEFGTELVTLLPLTQRVYLNLDHVE